MGFIIMYSRDSKEFVGCDKRKAIYKSRHRADLSHDIFYNLNLSYDRHHHTIYILLRGRDVDREHDR